MSSGALNTTLVQRIESALGVTLSQQSQLAVGGRSAAVLPAGSPASLAANPSTTQKTGFAEELQAQQAARAAGKTQGVATLLDQNSTPARATGVQPSAETASPRSAQPHLSAIGKILLPLLQSFPEGAGPILGVRPMFVGAVLEMRAQIAIQTAFPGQSSMLPPDTIKFAGRALAPSTPLTGALLNHLRNLIVDSGLFYESHLLRQLQSSASRLTKTQEPQAQRNYLYSPDVSQDVPEDLRPIVRQQLDVLAGYPIQWQGMAWPEAAVRWVIIPPPHTGQDGKQSNKDGESEHQSVWSTNLDLTLQGLGPMSAQILIEAETVSIRFKVGDEGGSVISNVDQLRDRLVNAGFDLGQISVSATKLEIAPSKAEEL